MEYACFESTIFWKEVSFHNARIAGSIKFFGAEFIQTALFDNALIEGTVFFDSEYLFCWDEILRNDYVKFLQFLNKIFGIDWVNAENLEKSDDSETIRASTEKKSLSLLLNDEKTRLILIIDDSGTSEFIAKTKKGKTYIYYQPSTFQGDAFFESIQIKGNAEFKGVVFEKLAIFNRARIEGVALFKPAIFKGEAYFTSIRIENGAEFCGSQFIESADFVSIQIMEYACFELTIFWKEVSFHNARIAGSIKFFGAEFIQTALFDNALIEGTVFFDSEFLFSWDEIPGNDNVRLKEFLERKYSIDWLKTAKIEKTDNNKMIMISNRKNSLSLRLNDKKTRLIL
jgi:hypothetical protein